MNGDAIILTDIQNDFLPGGALAVPEGDAILPRVNRLIEVFPLVVATQDCHPADHVSFARTHGRRVGEGGRPRSRSSPAVARARDAGYVRAPGAG